MKILVNTFLVILSVTLCLFAGEVILRLIDRTWHSETFVSLKGRHQVYTLLETAENLYSDGRKSFIVGDSFVEGAKCGNQFNPVSKLSQLFVHPEQDFRSNPHQTESSERVAALTTCRISFINLGIGGTGPIDYLIRLIDSYEILGKPILVIVVLYSNDVEITTSHCRYRGYLIPFLDPKAVQELQSICEPHSSVYTPEEEIEKTFTRRLHDSLLTFYTWRLVREVGVRFLIRLGYNLDWGRTSYVGKWTDRLGIHQRLVLAALKAIRKFGADNAIPIYFAIYPDVSWIAPSNPQIAMYQSFVESAASDGIEI